ncbi:hypothetical protein PC110_g1842 [Phytophthora cactorum]|uniref:Uncharacterized protein n=3 Tax=Phytophthora cactorum TaxID=29920 RepID=A0A329SZF9_9STRA|nr:hypothetical protein PC110_g1842 [Phytophthora cactorum]
MGGDKAAMDDDGVLVEAFSDTDYAADKSDRKSVSGGVLMTTAEMLGIVELLKEIDVPMKSAAAMHVDNQVAIAQIEGEDTAGRAKHIDVRFKFVKDFAKKKVLEVTFQVLRAHSTKRVAQRNKVIENTQKSSSELISDEWQVYAKMIIFAIVAHISGRRNNLLCSVALSVVIKACAQAVCESPVKFAVCVMKKTDTQPQAQVGLQANRLSVNDEALKIVDLLREAGANTKILLKFIVDNSDSNRTLRNVQNQIRNLKKCELGVTTRSHRVKKGLLNFCAVPGNTGRIFVNSSNEKRIATCITLQTKHIVDILTDSRETPACAVNTGYTNLHKHLTKCIGKDYDAKYASAVKARRNGLGFEVIEYVSERDLSVFKWIVGVLMRNMPLSEVDNPLTRELAGISSSDHVSSRSLSTYIKYLVPLVEALVEKIPPLPFGVMLDGWTTKSTHYVAVPEDQSRAVE